MMMIEAAGIEPAKRSPEVARKLLSGRAQADTYSMSTAARAPPADRREGAPGVERPS